MTLPLDAFQRVHSSQMAATTSIESSDHNDASSHLHLNGTPKEITFSEETGWKRRKISHVTSALLPNDTLAIPEAPPGMPDRPVAEAVAIGESQWGHLLRWQQMDSDEEVDLAHLDKFEGEEQYELGSATDEDTRDAPNYDEDLEEQTQGQSKLTSDQIVEIINERIEFYMDSWKPNKGVIKGEESKYDVEAMWEEAEAEGQRQQLIEKYEADLAYYSHRLNTLCDEILKFPGGNAKQVRRQCLNLEVTIDSMELAEWLSSIYRLEPVSESEEAFDDRVINVPRRQSRPSLTPVNHQTRVYTQIVDLGSPSESSGAEEDITMILDHSTAPMTNMHKYQSDPLIDTRELSISESIDSPSNASVEPYLVNCVELSGSKLSHSDEPENASIASVQRWKWSELVDGQDRKRIVSKAVNEMKTEDRELLRSRLGYVGKANILKEIPACIEMLSNADSKLQGILPLELSMLLMFTRLFLSWWLCDDYLQKEPSQWHLKELRRCLKEGSPDPATFCDYLRTIMSTTFSEEALKHPERPSQAEVIEISDDDEGLTYGPAIPKGSQQSPMIILD